MANVWHLKSAIDQIKDLSFKGLDRYAKILKQELERDAPGSLKKGIRVRRRRIRQEITVASTHESGEPVPVWVEFGTAPHIITPKTKKVLRWFDGNMAIFAKKVRHPGTKPNPYFRRGITRANARAREAFRR